MESENQKTAREIAAMFGGARDLQDAILAALEKKDADEMEDRRKTAATATWACEATGSCAYKRPMPRPVVE